MNIDYAKALSDSLRRAKMNAGQINSVLGRYAMQEAKTNEIEAFIACVDAYADEDPHVLLASLIESALKKANLEIKVDVNPISRTKSYIERQNKWLEHADKFGFEGSTPLDAEKLKMKMPSYVKASFDVKAVKGLDLEICK